MHKVHRVTKELKVRPRKVIGEPKDHKVQKEIKVHHQSEHRER